MAEIKSESVADFIPESVADLRRNQQPGDRVRWKGRDGVFRRDVGDAEYAEIVIGERIYRVQTQDLTK